MKIISDREEMVFKFQDDDKISYRISVSRKKEDGTYENAYLPVRFKKDVSLDNQTKIRIKNAWLDFIKMEKRTFWFMFINDFEIVEKKEEKSFDNWESAKDIEPDELPFY